MLLLLLLLAVLLERMVEAMSWMVTRCSRVELLLLLLLLPASTLGVSSAGCVEDLAAEDLGGDILHSRPEDAQTLYEEVNTYRVTLGLPEVPLSPSLSAVAQAHVDDLEANYPYEPCNLHSWSTENESWSGCCYESDAPTPKCMWDKPRELTNYPGDGFEIAVSVFGARPISAKRALREWQKSAGHHEVIINQGPWLETDWRAMGVAISEHYAVVWFGKETDPMLKPDEDLQKVARGHGDAHRRAKDRVIKHEIADDGVPTTVIYPEP